MEKWCDLICISFWLRIRNGLEDHRVTSKNGTIEIISLRDDTIWKKIVLVEMERHGWIWGMFWRECQ